MTSVYKVRILTTNECNDRPHIWENPFMYGQYTLLWEIGYISQGGSCPT